MFFSPWVWGLTLLDTYDLAKSNDPDFMRAHSQYLIDREKLSLAYAELLPDLNLAGDYAYKRLRDHGTEQQTKTQTQTLSLKLTQPIFNASLWAGLRGAKASVKQAEALFQSETQALFYRTADVYMKIGVAKHRLLNAEAKVKAVKALLEQAKHQHHAGLSTQAAVDEAQAAYESARSDLISAKTGFSNAQEGIFKLTGQFCDSLEVLPEAQENVTLPQLDDVSAWEALALKQNYRLQASMWALEEARAASQVKNRSRMPEISASAEYDYDHEASTASGIAQGAKAGVALTWRLYDGGGISAEKRQAAWGVMRTKADFTAQSRAVASSTRQAYRDVLYGLQKVKASEQTLKSRQSALASVTAAFAVGERSMVDVLTAQSDWFSAKNDVVRDTSQWLLAILALKEEVGQLSHDDLQSLSLLMVSSDHLAENLQKKVGSDLSSHDFYAIQLASGHDEDAIYGFMRAHDLVNKAYSLELMHNGQQIFVVLMGAYSSKQAASQALGELSSELKQLKPWVRYFK